MALNGEQIALVKRDADIARLLLDNFTKLTLINFKAYGVPRLDGTYTQDDINAVAVFAQANLTVQDVAAINSAVASVLNIINGTLDTIYKLQNVQ